MEHKAIITNNSPFDNIKHAKNGKEYWSARELQTLLGYKNWREFDGSIERAKIAAKNSGMDENGVTTQFGSASKMVEQGCGAQREIKDYHLSRYACYLVAMNGDPRKEEIAAAQTYFAIKTRQAETKLKPKTPNEMFLMQAYINIAVEKQLHEHEDKLATHDEQLAEHTHAIENNQQSFIAFSKEQQVYNDEQNTKAEKLDERLRRIETKTDKMPKEYPPVDIKERNRMQKNASGLCVYVQPIKPDQTIAMLQRQLQDALIEAFKKEFNVSLLAELEEAKKWYQYHYCCLKAENPKVPEEVLRPAQIRNLSLYAIISTNPSWIKFFDHYIEMSSAYYRKQREDKQQESTLHDQGDASFFTRE